MFPLTSTVSPKSFHSFPLGENSFSAADAATIEGNIDSEEFPWLLIVYHFTGGELDSLFIYYRSDISGYGYTFIIVINHYAIFLMLIHLTYRWQRVYGKE